MDKKCCDRKDQIIEVAQKRFGLYGFDKTTMQEIADDMEMSKGSLYYYFSDKESLYKSIIDKEKKEFLQTIRGTLSELDDVKAMLHEYTKMRMRLSERLINLAQAKSMFHKDVKVFMQDAVIDLHEQEDQMIKEIMQVGIDKKQFVIANLDQVASLFNSLVRGLRVLTLRSKHTFQLETDMQDYEQKVALFVDIFCKGLSLE